MLRQGCPWVPHERYEPIVAALPQQPADPHDATSTHRIVDYWDRTLLDQLIGKLREAFAPEGVAYLTQLSILSQQRTAELFDVAGLGARVVDYSVFDLPPAQAQGHEQIARVEDLSDAYHLRVGGRELMVAYLLEVEASPRSAPGGEAGAAEIPSLKPPAASSLSERLR